MKPSDSQRYRHLATQGGRQITHPQKNWVQLSGVVVAGMALVAIALIIARAQLVGFTYDEAFSFFHYVRAPLRVVVGFSDGADANNHTLNSLLMTCASFLFGDSELALRLPNVMSFVIYALATFMIVARLTHFLAVVTLSALLLLNPFIIELFSLARGYGLALSFSSLSLALLLERAAQDRRGRQLCGAVLFAGLAVTANLTFLDFFIPVLCLAVVLAGPSRPSGDRGRGTTRRTGGVIFAVGLSVATYAAVALWRLRARGQLYYGGHKGFWSDTVDSLIRCVLYLQEYSAATRPVVWGLVLIATTAILCVAARASVMRARTPELIDLGRAVALLVGGCALGVAAHAVFNTPFRINRTAAWMVPVFFACNGFILSRGLSAGSRLIRVTSALVCYCLTVGSVTHFVLSANTRYAILQLHDADTKTALVDLTRFHNARNLDIDVSTFASWELVPSLEYYRVTKKIRWLRTVVSPADAETAFVAPRDVGLLLGMRVELVYPATGNRLAFRVGADRARPRITPELR